MNTCLNLMAFEFMKKLKNYSKWILINGVYSASLYAAGFTKLSQNHGFVNLFKFFTWAIALMAWPMLALMLFAAATAKQKPEGSKIPTVDNMFPRTIGITFDILVSFTLAYLGWFWLAAAYLLHIPAQSMTIHAMELMRDKENGKE